MTASLCEGVPHWPNTTVINQYGGSGLDEDRIVSALSPRLAYTDLLSRLTSMARTILGSTRRRTLQMSSSARAPSGGRSSSLPEASITGTKTA